MTEGNSHDGSSAAYKLRCVLCGRLTTERVCREGHPVSQTVPVGLRIPATEATR